MAGARFGMVEGDGRTPASLSVDPVDSVPDLLLCQPSFGRDSRNGHGGEEGDGGSSSILAQTGIFFSLEVIIHWLSLEPVRRPPRSSGSFSLCSLFPSH